MSTPFDAGGRTRRPTRRGWLLGAAATATLLVAGIVVSTRPGKDQTVQTLVTEPPTTPTTEPIVATSDAVIDPSSNTSDGSPATNADETTTSPSTTTQADIAEPIKVPVDATAPLPEEQITTVEYGPGDDQIEVQNGEFPPPAVWHGGGVIVLEDAVQTGLTGDAVTVRIGPDSAFEDATRPRVSSVTIEVAERGGTPIAVRSLDDGGVVVVTVHDDDPRIRIRRYSEDSPGIFSESGDRTDRPGLGDSELRITSEGATWGGDVVIPTGASDAGAGRPIVSSDPPFGVFSSMEINRPAHDGVKATNWSLDVEIDRDSPPGSTGPQVEPFGDGALATFSNSGTSQSALVVLDSDGSGVAYDLDGWVVADVRPEAALLSRSTPNGLELAMLTPRRPPVTKHHLDALDTEVPRTRRHCIPDAGAASRSPMENTA